jgi:hypothetical protein
VGERTRIVNRIKSTLARLGIRNFSAGGRRIRTPGPVLAKSSAGCCRREMPNDKLGGAIKRWDGDDEFVWDDLRSDPVARRRYRGRFPTAIPFTAGEVSNPLCSSSQSVSAVNRRPALSQ